MFGVIETAGGFDSSPGYFYYEGDGLFTSIPVDIERTPQSQTFIAFTGQKILKINGYGGVGHNMFAVVESATSFTSTGGFPYYAGDMYMTAGYPTDVEYINGRTFTGFSNLWGLKVTATGGSLHNMHAVTETALGFITVPGYTHYIGDQVFDCRRYHQGQKVAEQAEVEVDEISQNGISLFPNPGNTYIKVRFDHIAPQANIRVMNALGQTMLTRTLVNANEERLEIGDFSNGIYFVEATFGGRRIAETFVVKH
ncbi:MAG TPA: T9SS type A sorting domain-containing protein [Bacteroidetes bacterium]|nr:T9SS type A sorting domain-containing protein [Bacteroidota bacterium]